MDINTVGQVLYWFLRSTLGRGLNIGGEGFLTFFNMIKKTANSREAFVNKFDLDV